MSEADQKRKEDEVKGSKEIEVVTISVDGQVKVGLRPEGSKTKIPYGKFKKVGGEGAELPYK